MPSAAHALNLHAHSRYALIALAVFVSLAATEIVWMRWVAKRAFAWREAGASLAVALAQRVGSGLGTLAVAPVALLVWDHRVTTLRVDGLVQFVVAFVAVEFAYYWMHRGSHRIAWMWATHSVHHSAEQLNFTAAIRLGATGFVSGEWLPFVPLLWFGFSPTMVFGLLALDLLYQFFLHTEMIPRLGPLEWVLNTPSHHRVHHARNDAYLDRNFGGVVIVFDRLFGTYAVERAEDPPQYGLLGETRGTSPLRILFAGWQKLFVQIGRARSIPDAIGVAFGPPRAGLRRER
jgi:sterol desaturase/sphingolipid hydroxylase (fatty acid hydroxylase superfamily)